jgi:hypothetical protein
VNRFGIYRRKKWKDRENTMLVSYQKQALTVMISPLCTNCHDITEILLKMALNTIKQTNHIIKVRYRKSSSQYDCYPIWQQKLDQNNKRIVFNAIFNNISVISWRSVFLVEETGRSGENHRPVAKHWQTLSHNVVHLPLL